MRVVHVPDDNGERRKQRLIPVGFFRDIEYPLGKESQRKPLKPEQKAGAYHDDNAPIDCPIVEFLDVTVAVEFRLFVGEPEKIPDILNHVRQVLGLRKEFPELPSSFPGHQKPAHMPDTDDHQATRRKPVKVCGILYPSEQKDDELEYDRIVKPQR